jgi:cation transport regulator ChaC
MLFESLRGGFLLMRNSEDHRGTPEAPGRVVTLIDRAHWETLTDDVGYNLIHPLSEEF